MHILQVIHGYPPHYNAGSEIYTKNISTELAKHHKISIFPREENPFRADFEIRNEKISENISKYIVNKRIDKDCYRNLLLDKHFGELLREIKPDVAHIGHLNHLSTGIVYELHNQHIPIVFTLHDFWLMCPRGQFLQRNFGNPIYEQVCENQDDEKCAINCYSCYFSGQSSDFERDTAYWKNWIHSRMNECKEISKLVDIFIAPSKYLRNRFIHDFQIPEHKIVFLDYGFPNLKTENLTDNKSDSYTFGYIGTHITSKGVHQLIEAFSMLKQKAKLKIWGRHNSLTTNVLREMAEKTQNEIEFCGEYENQNIVNQVFSCVNCIVVPSIWAENSPLVIHEAQQCKIPVITANYGGMAEYVIDNVNGLTYEFQNVNDLCNKLAFAIENQDYMKSLGKRGYFYSENGQVIDIKIHISELVNIYETTLTTLLK